MDQGTKRKADDVGSGSSDKRSKVSFFLLTLSLYVGEISIARSEWNALARSRKPILLFSKTVDRLANRHLPKSMEKHND